MVKGRDAVNVRAIAPALTPCSWEDLHTVHRVLVKDKEPCSGVVRLEIDLCS